MVVDAFCPECREDLSETPEEAEETRLTWDKMEEALTPPPVAAARLGCSFLFIIVAEVGCVLGFITALSQRDTKTSVVMGISAIIFGFWLYGLYRLAVPKITTSVSGRSRTFNDED